MANCKVHLEECGEKRPAVKRDREFGPVCAECAREIATNRGNERRNQGAYDYACGYRD